MTDIALDEKALAEQAWRDLEIAADAKGRLECAMLTLPVEKVRALVAERRRVSPSQGAPANPAQVTNAMVEALQKIAKLARELANDRMTPNAGLWAGCAGDAETALTAAIGAGGQAVDTRCDYCKEHGFQHPHLCEDCRAAQEAPADEQSGEKRHVAVSVAVKPLVWEEIHQRRSDEDPSTEVIGFEASNGFGEWYWIDIRAADFVLHYPDADGSTRLFETERDTKAAAQKDYEKRILSALAHPLPLKDEVERVLDDARVWISENVRPSDAVGNEILCEIRALLSRLRAGAQEGWRGECATEGCNKKAYFWFERGGVGSQYCHDCYMRVQALAPSPEAKGGRS